MGVFLSFASFTVPLTSLEPLLLSPSEKTMTAVGLVSFTIWFNPAIVPVMMFVMSATALMESMAFINENLSEVIVWWTVVESYPRNPTIAVLS